MAQTITRKWDRNLLIIIGILTLWGFVNFYSVSAPLSFKNPLGTHKYLIEFFLKNIIIGSLVFVLFSLMSWKTLKRFSFPLFIVFVISLLLAFLPGFVSPNETTRRWIDLKVLSFQPAEFLKLTMLLWLTFLMPRLQKEFKSSYERSIIFIVIISVVSLFIFLQPALSNLLIIWASIGAGYLSLKPKLKDLAPFLLVIMIFIALSPLWEYRLDRIFQRGSNFQQERSMLAVGSGGISGIGIGNSKVKLLKLPLITTDSIFAIIGEEVGFIGSVVLILIFVMLILTVIKNASSSMNAEKKFFAYGVATWISIQAFIHIASNIGIIPPTGIPLPFFSYGSSSQISLMAALGIINNLTNS